MLFLVLACASPPRVPAVAPAPATCLVTWKRTSDASLLSEGRSRGLNWPDFPVRYFADTPGPGDSPATTEGLTVGGVPALYFRGEDAIVDVTLFDHLFAVDVTVLAPGEVATLGRVQPGARATLGERGVVELLTRADVLRIYAQGEGEICLVEESRDGATWSGHFVGEHAYSTNGENHGKPDFTVTITDEGTVNLKG